MKILWLILLFTLYSYSGKSLSQTIKYHGLEEINLSTTGKWSAGLFSGAKKNQLDFKYSVVNSIYQSFLNSNNINNFLNNILDLKINNHYSYQASYRQIAEGMFAARKKIRNHLKVHSNYSQKYTKQAMLLVELLAEETLYINTLLFPSNDMIRFDYANNTNPCGARVSLFNKTPLCQGDIIISKGDAGSSSFLARISDYPGNFSHATTPFIDPKKNIFLIESFIEDGVKLRDPANDYINNFKSKLMIYRNINPTIVRAGINAIDLMVEKIKTRIPGQDLTTTASYEYDFKMDPTNADKLFCSEVVYYAYSLNPVISSSQNPYAQTYWSSVDDPDRNLVLANFLGASTHFPAPSDVELNPNFEIVSIQFNPKKLSADRIRVALIDVIIQIMNENQNQLISSINLLGDIGNQIADPQVIKNKLQAFASLGIILPAESYQMIDSIPKNINYKQLLFFSFIDQRLAPYAVDQLLQLEKNLLQQGKILDLETMRIALYHMTEIELKNFAQLAQKTLSPF